MSESMPFELPESVERYLSDGAIAEAVDHLTGMRDDHVPEGLELPDLENFYEARSAADLVRSQFPVALLRFWKQVWGRDLPTVWLPLPVQEMGLDAIGPRTTWNDAAIALLHTKKAGGVLYTLVGCTPRKTTIGFSIEAANGQYVYDDDVAPFTWHEDEWPDYLIKDWDLAITDARFPWDEFETARTSALSLIASVDG